MKVLQLGKFFPIRGGVEKVMYDLMVGLSERGIRCDMLCASIENYISGEIKINPLAKVVVVSTKLKFASTMFAPLLIFRLRTMAPDYDIVHIHHPDPMAALALFLSGFKGKVVLHWHSDIIKQKKLLKIYSPLQNWLIERADIVVGTTPVYVEQSPFLQKIKNKITFIPIGIDPIEADANLIEQIRAEYEGFSIIYALGRLVDYKGFTYLIKSARFLEDNCKIIIAGKGPLYDTLQQQIVELGLQDKVKLLGYVSDELSHAYFHACEVFVLSSIFKTEAFAIVQIEAMSCAKPIISTAINGSGVQWVNENNVSGIVIPPCDEYALAGAIQDLLTNKDKYQKLVKGSKERYLNLFTKKKMIESCINVYSELF